MKKNSKDIFIFIIVLFLVGLVAAENYAFYPILGNLEEHTIEISREKGLKNPVLVKEKETDNTVIHIVESEENGKIEYGLVGYTQSVLYDGSKMSIYQFRPEHEEGRVLIKDPRQDLDFGITLDGENTEIRLNNVKNTLVSRTIGTVLAVLVILGFAMYKIRKMSEEKENKKVEAQNKNKKK